MKFKVLVAQMVEQVATVEVEADSIEAARDLALDWNASLSQADWKDGDYAEKARVFTVRDTNDDIVWES